MAIKITTPEAAIAEKQAASNPPAIPPKVTKDVYHQLMESPAYKSNASFTERLDMARRNSINSEQLEYQIQLRNAALGKTPVRGGK